MSQLRLCSNKVEENETIMQSFKLKKKNTAQQQIKQALTTKQWLI